MRAMILAAGRGERMRPLTDTTPKPLLKAGPHRLIEYHLYKLADAGFKNIVINVAWLGQQIIDTLGDGSIYGVNIHYSNEGDSALETGGGIVHALPLLGQDPFLVVNGDIWTDYDFKKLYEYRMKGCAHLVLVNNPVHNPDGDFSINGDRLIENTGTQYTFSGIGLYSADFFKARKDGVYPLAPMIREFIKREQVTGEIHAGEWWDIGTPRRLEELDGYLKKKT